MDDFNNYEGDITAEEAARHELNHIPEEVWTFVRSMTRSEVIVWEILRRANENVCRRLPAGTRETVGRNRWLGAWRKRRRSIKRRFGRLRDEIIQREMRPAETTPGQEDV